ncbi:MAG TPA: diacylglycerol kinase family protein [Ohtaekwangia sp.]|nr:diacylglycerol kinase family protein [Ohtaekwangia sp.]
MIKRHLLSYKHAFRGIWLAFRFEPNMLIHAIAGLAVTLINYLLEINKTDWLITLILIGIVWAAEIFNTAIEKLADRVTKDHDPLIAQAKDLAAGAVLVVCIIAVVCAGIIWWNYLVI